MRTKILIIQCLFVIANAQVDVDWSFREMCQYWDGGQTYQPRIGGFNSQTGDKCTFTFPSPTADEADALRFCEEMVPFHIIKAHPGKETTKCAAEATLICEAGWVQMYGRCYKLTKQLVTKPKARGFCKQQNARIAYLHRETLPFRWRDYFYQVSRIWLGASSSITQNLIHNVPGGELLLAFDGHPYGLPNLAIARVNSSETAMVLCEKVPWINKAESNYLLNRFSEIYYPMVKTSDDVYVRSSSSRVRNDEDRIADHKYCWDLMRAFTANTTAMVATPTKEFSQMLAEGKKESTIIRTSAVSMDSKKSSRTNKMCTVSEAANYQVFLVGKDGYPFPKKVDASEWRKGEPKDVCDGATWSSGIALNRDGTPGLEAMSDARSAPIYCQNRFTTLEYGACPKGFSEFYRKDLRQKWCHIFPPKKEGDMLKYDDAVKKCASMGAVISGFTSEEELDFMDKMLAKSGVPFGGLNYVWLGARRREDCMKHGVDGKVAGFDKDPTSPCSRTRVFEWVNGVAPNPPKFENHWMAATEPNFMGDEQCLVLMKGIVYNWHKEGDDGTKKLNDLKCHFPEYYFCGMEAPINEKLLTVN